MKKILLVDDEPWALDRMERFISHYEDYQILGKYHSAIDAIRAIERELPDIIVTDICMAHVDGLDMIAKIQKRWRQQVGFVIVSGYSQFDYAKRALQLSVSDYLLKPIMEKELMEALRKVAMKQELNKIEQTVEISKEKMSAEIKLAEKMVKAMGLFDREMMTQYFQEMEEYISKHGQNQEIRSRIFWIVFTILDSRAENADHAFLEDWKHKIQTEVLSPDFNINKLFGKHVRECALVLMERDGYHNRRPIEYIKLYIESHYKDDISLGWFSEKLYVNAAYLGQKFKKETGVSVNRFLHRFRIEEAKRLARTTDMNWSEIAAEVGYKNYLSFFEHFQKIEQISPSDFKG